MKEEADILDVFYENCQIDAAIIVGMAMKYAYYSRHLHGPSRRKAAIDSARVYNSLESAASTMMKTFKR